VARGLSWAGIVTVTAVFWAWMETWFYFKAAANNMANVWYVDLERMLAWGSWFYALYFVVSFPMVYRLDETAAGARWPLSRVVIEASAVGMLTLFLIDLATHALGGRL
jgi:cycloeucalenol cycloisomerase